MSHVAVIDIGKTNAKLALVDMADLSEIAVRTRPNTVRPGPPWPHFDLEGHWDFLIAGLAEMHRSHGIDAISVTTHGAAAVLLDAQGNLAAPMLDYEHDGPDRIAADYDAIRPEFAQTGSPRLPQGLNLGAQLHWQLGEEHDLLQRTAHVLTYPQYWGYRLTGEMACDVCSLGCHTDLWDPFAVSFTDLPERLGLAGRFAPPRRPGDTLGHLRPEIAAATGLPRGLPVAVGIHDSNASLVPHLLSAAPPFSVVSTGTWVVSMCMGGDLVALDPARDTLVNVNAEGHPVPSARFMGGREYELIRDPDAATTPEDIAQVLAEGVMLLPSVVAGSGPFPDRGARWIGAEPKGGVRNAALDLYLALMTASCLGLIGHRGMAIVEGPFARNPVFLDALSAATGGPVAPSHGQTGTSRGASLLIGEASAGAIARPDPHVASALDGFDAYARAWRMA